MPINIINIKDAPRGWKNNPEFVYAGRPESCPGVDGFFGNPYKLKKESDRLQVYLDFEQYARHRISYDIEYRRLIQQLLGKTLVCFCLPKLCHSEMLAVLSYELNLLPLTTSYERFGECKLLPSVIYYNNTKIMTPFYDETIWIEQSRDMNALSSYPDKRVRLISKTEWLFSNTFVPWCRSR